MIKVGFAGQFSKDWMGGLNYFRNLFFALDSVKKKELELIIFIGKRTDNKIKCIFKQYAYVVEDSMFDRKSPKWYLSKVEHKIFKTNFILSDFLNKYGVQVLSHSSVVNLKDIKTINWIHDFQHVHLPDMFSKKEIDGRDKNFMKLIKKSDSIVVSSYDALKDLKNFASGYESKAKVLQFVSQPDKKYFELNKNDKKRILEKYKIYNDFYYMPNQFWKHKNHMLVFRAINELKNDSADILLVCTGNLDDYRNKSHIDKVKSFIRIHSLENYIKILGLVDYEDVFALIKFSKGVINPSLFEGWSSTVEECKSVGKHMILSDLDVHKEQYPESTFFERRSVDSLKNVLNNYDWGRYENSIDPLEKRTKQFAKKYIDIVHSVLET